MMMVMVMVMVVIISQMNVQSQSLLVIADRSIFFLHYKPALVSKGNTSCATQILMLHKGHQVVKTFPQLSCLCPFFSEFFFILYQDQLRLFELTCNVEKALFNNDYWTLPSNATMLIIFATLQHISTINICTNVLVVHTRKKIQHTSKCIQLVGWLACW